MADRQKIFVIGATVAALIGAGASAMALLPEGTDAPVTPATAPVASASSEGAPTESPESTADGVMPAVSSAQSYVAPVIPADLRAHTARIRSRWAQGPNLADHYVQMTLSCDDNDCRELIVGNLLTGEIVQTGMGFEDMPDLVATSSRESAYLVLSWINVRGANCARASYRWTGGQLAADSDIVEFPYEDAGCDRALDGD
ncbi:MULTISPECIES: hypothetical protein [unclassified Brevundimonas]|uniref:hypothetical protein n=1 Tax=unclassified Brevundimonas TaxID=2622653 RepID=UPI0025C23E73|nr:MULTISPECIES: hypothetical protein [unclassified Brevundimonas]